MLRPEETVEVVKAEEVDKVLVGPAQRANLRVVAELMPRQNASNWQVLTASSVKTSVNK